MVSYAFDRVSVQLNALNLTDVTYYEGVYQGHVVPGTARALRLRLTYGF
jgi:catecholate siderophore receptor